MYRFTFPKFIENSLSIINLYFFLNVTPFKYHSLYMTALDMSIIDFLAGLSNNLTIICIFLKGVLFIILIKLQLKPYFMMKLIIV